MVKSSEQTNYYTLSEFPSKDLLVEELSKKIVDALQDAVDSKGYATLAVSGGSTPKVLFQRLSEIYFPWEKVRVTLVDERWVDPQSDQSNEKLVRSHLLQNYAQEARFVPLKTNGMFANDSIVSLNVELEKLSHQLDVVVLGMGLDGHTASFFPNAKELKNALQTEDFVCSITANVEPKERVTLSRKYLLSSQNIFLHIEGKEKKEVFFKATKISQMYQYPIVSMMKQEDPILEVYYAD